jgi:hypothetical protein
VNSKSIENKNRKKRLMNDGNAKQQIAEKVKNSSNIMVTVSTNPSVDELSAALGLTLLLNKMNKHATAVFSGAIPPAITFLDPQKTFENTVDSLRDFIIALDKEKADHLRYKVDGDVVKIFITPYRTTITSDDLDFSQGDYNVELVLALGVKSRDDLDSALSAHGRILHDATVASISAGSASSELGSINWREENASSLSEMLVSLSDAFKNDKGTLDEQIATAFLTGIVAATDRFSNDHTSSKVMTIAAQLMTSGANQQLIASKLEEAHEIGDTKPSAPAKGKDAAENSDGTTDLTEGESTKVNKKQAKAAAEEEAAAPKKKEDDGSLTISHEKEGDLDEVGRQTEEEEREAAAKAAQEEIEKQTKAVPAENQEEAAKKAEDNLAQQLASVAPAAAKPSAATPSVADLQKDLAAANAEVNEAAEQSPVSAAEVNQWQASEQAPSMGGTLNATTEQAEQDKRHALDDDRNHTILTHGGGNNYVGDSSPIFQSPLNAASQPPEEQAIVDPFKGEMPAATLNAVSPVSLPPIAPPQPQPEPSLPPSETLADLDRQNRAPHEEARAAVDAAFGAVPFTPTSPQPEQVMPAQEATPPAMLPPMPPMPDFSTLPPLPSAADAAPAQGASFSGPLPPDKLEDVFGASPAPASAPAPQSSDPGQFKIPGQG